MTNYIVIGRFGKAFGIHGWIKVNSYASPTENILNYRPWYIQKNNAWQEIIFVASRIHANQIVVQLPNCHTPEEARLYTNYDIGVVRDQLPALPPGEFYWDDLIGMTVKNLEGVDFGTVTELMATGANDVLEVVGERKRLIPYINDVVKRVDIKARLIEVDWDKEF
jgi:16S rRNA processing protein RimM